MRAVRLSRDQEALLRACGGVGDDGEHPIRLQTSLATGSVLVHPDLPEAIPIAIVDLWDLHDDGLLAVEYGETHHSGTLRLTNRGAQALSDLRREHKTP